MNDEEFPPIDLNDAVRREREQRKRYQDHRPEAELLELKQGFPDTAFDDSEIEPE